MRVEQRPPEGQNRKDLSTNLPVNPAGTLDKLWCYITPLGRFPGSSMSAEVAKKEEEESEIPC